jgi:hypothetical protein
VTAVRAPRRSPLHEGRFVQPRSPAFWLYLAVVASTSVVAVGEQNLFREMSPSGWALSWALVALYAGPVAILVYLLDLYEREPIPLLAAAFVWGGVAATTLSAIGNAGWGIVVARLGGPEFAARWTARSSGSGSPSSRTSSTSSRCSAGTSPACCRGSSSA